MFCFVLILFQNIFIYVAIIYFTDRNNIREITQSLIPVDPQPLPRYHYKLVVC